MLKSASKQKHWYSLFEGFCILWTFWSCLGLYLRINSGLRCWESSHSVLLGKHLLSHFTPVSFVKAVVHLVEQQTCPPGLVGLRGWPLTWFTLNTYMHTFTQASAQWRRRHATVSSWDGWSVAPYELWGERSGRPSDRPDTENRSEHPLRLVLKWSFMNLFISLLCSLRFVALCLQHFPVRLHSGWLDKIQPVAYLYKNFPQLWCILYWIRLLPDTVLDKASHVRSRWEQTPQRLWCGCAAWLSTRSQREAVGVPELELKGSMMRILVFW